MFDNFWGNPRITAALDYMIGEGRIPQTMLFAGPEGVGKATLARRFAARLLPNGARVEADDLSLESNVATVLGRERWPADKRNDDPLVFASHPDFLTFAPDGPMRQLSIQQMRMLKDRAGYMPMKGTRRVFLIDHVDRANDQAANSLLKTLEEPPPHLILIMTAENAYDLLPTIRSRAVPFQFTPLGEDEMREFVKWRQLDDPTRRVMLAAGSPGQAVSLDLELYDKRRTAMLAMLEAGADAVHFGAWMRISDTIARAKADRLEFYLKVLYGLLRDLLVLSQQGRAIRNQDVRGRLEALSARVSFDWLRKAVQRTDEVAELLRRNIQKTIALDAVVIELRALSRSPSR